MGKDNKRCVYISDDNIGYLAEEATKTKKKSMSQILNRVMDKFRNLVRFNIGKSNYIDVCVSMRPELVELLQEVQRKSGNEAVTELLNTRLLEEFNYQINSNRRRFPDRLYSGEIYIDALVEKLRRNFFFSKKR